MCKCIIGWTTDESVDGSHSSKPHTCQDYIRALENLVLWSGADSSRLQTLQKAYGVLKAEDGEHVEPEAETTWYVLYQDDEGTEQKYCRAYSEEAVRTVRDELRAAKPDLEIWALRADHAFHREPW